MIFINNNQSKETYKCIRPFLMRSPKKKRRKKIFPFNQQYDYVISLEPIQNNIHFHILFDGRGREVMHIR